MHSHPPPPSHSIPKSIKDQLQKIITLSNQNLEDVTPRKLISGKLFFNILIFFLKQILFIINLLFTFRKFS